MRIATIRASNYLSHRAAVIELPTDANLVLVAGPNGSGKTALLEGVRFALTGELPRDLQYKKDLPELITEGESTGWIGVDIDDGDGARPTEIKVNLKTGTPTVPPPLSPVQAFTLFPQSFVALEPAKKRKILFDRAGISLKPSDVVKALVKQGHDATRLEKITTALGGGFAAAEKRAKELVSEARGSWQATTGETWGAQKAKDWKAVAPTEWEDPAKLAKQRALKQEESLKAKRILDDLEADERQHANSTSVATDAGQLDAAVSALATLDEKIDDKRVAVDKLATAAKSKGGWTAPCPQCNTVLFSEKAGDLVVHEPSGESPAAAGARLEAARAGLQGLEADRKKLSGAVEHARASKLMLERLPDRPTAAELDAAREDARVALEELHIVEADLATAEKARSDASDAASKTAKAKGYHADIEAFAKLEPAIAALPAQYLADALGAINASLAAVSKPFAAPVQIGDDMELRYGTVPYRLASRSQQWRMALALGLALAGDGGGILQMDEFDIVQPADRGAILQMLAGQDKVQVVLGATLKAAPVFPEGAGIFVTWLGKE